MGAAWECPWGIVLGSILLLLWLARIEHQRTERGEEDTYLHEKWE